MESDVLSEVYRHTIDAINEGDSRFGPGDVWMEEDENGLFILIQVGEEEYHLYVERI